MADIQIIKPSVEHLPQPTIEGTIQNIFKQIELCARVCYKSEDKITEDSAERFVKMLISKGHTSVCEHGTVYLNFDSIEQAKLYIDVDSPYITSKKSSPEKITTNFRVILDMLENDLTNAVDFVTTWAVPYRNKACYEPRYTFRFICDRGVSHELVRHRVMSFSQESTRYVNYGNKGFQFIEPEWWHREKGALPGQMTMSQSLFYDACSDAADKYTSLLNLGYTPQQARAVLPNSLKTEVIVTGTNRQWEAFLKLRNAPAAHPDMRILAEQVAVKLSNLSKLEKL